MQQIALLVMDLTTDFKRNENSYLEKIWLFLILEKVRRVCATQVDLNSIVDTIPMLILFRSFWGQAKAMLSEVCESASQWVVAHLKIQPWTSLGLSEKKKQYKIQTLVRLQWNTGRNGMDIPRCKRMRKGFFCQHNVVQE